MPNNWRGRGGGPRAAAPPFVSGPFSRLKFPCPKYFTAESQTGYWSSTVPITFRFLPEYIETIWHKIITIILKSCSDSSSDCVDELNLCNKNKAVLIKGGLILAEVKVYYAQGCCYQFKGSEYSHDKLHELRDMAEYLPRPLVEYLDCIGTVREEGFGEVTPVLAECRDSGEEPGAPALAPCQLAPLLARLRGGVPVGAAGDARAALSALGLQWEPCGPGGERLTEECFRFWVADSGAAATPRYTIRWNYEDCDVFRRIISRCRYCKGGKDFIVEAKLANGTGSPAQFVQTLQLENSMSTKWFTMTDIDDEFIDKGAFFGFGNFDSKQVQPSRFTGTLETCYRSGEIFRNLCRIKEEWGELKTNHQFGTIIPVTFSTLPRCIDIFWNSFTKWPDMNKSVFTKAGLILAEAKVYYAQMKSKNTMIHPGQMVMYSFERVSILERMPRWLPKPLAVYLECLGNIRVGACGQEVTPVLAQCARAAEEPGAPALAPCQLAPLLARLRRGVPVGAAGDARAALSALGLQWEPCGPGEERLTEECFRFWVADSGAAATPRYTIRWNDEDSRVYDATIRYMDGKAARLVYTDLRHGQGSPAQLVQLTPDQEQWFATTHLDSCSIKLGTAFRFGNFAGEQVQPSRFTGTIENVCIRGYVTDDLHQIITWLV